MADEPSMTKRRSSKRIAEGPPVEYFKKRQSSTDGLTGAMAGLDAPSKRRKSLEAIGGTKGKAAMFEQAASAASAAAAPPVAKKKADAPAKPPPVGGTKGKAAMFEQVAVAASAAPKVTKKWAATGGAGQYKAKTVIGGGPAPKKGFADLP